MTPKIETGRRVAFVKAHLRGQDHLVPLALQKATEALLRHRAPVLRATSKRLMP
jgi:hypothetical protein